MAYSFKKKSAKLTREGWMTTLKFGIIAGLVMSIVSMIYHKMGVFYYKPHTWIEDAALFIIMIWAALKIRKTQNNFLSMRQAYLACVGVGVIASIIFCGYLFVFISRINPDFVPDFVKYSLNNIANNPDYNELKKIELSKQVQFATPMTVAVSTMCEILLESVFLPLFFALFLRKEK